MTQNVKIPISRWDGNKTVISSDKLARESLIVMYYNDVILSRLLGTPSDVRELFIGHLLSEGYLKKSQILELANFESTLESGIHKLFLDGPKIDFKNFNQERIISSSCGACDTDGLEELIHDLPILEPDTSVVDLDKIVDSLNAMKLEQKGFNSTGGMYAAGLINYEYNLLLVKEDIGRHNALDKLIGAAVSENLEISESILLLSGRCGWDIVAKACRSGIRTIVSIGACSSLAAKTARSSGMRIYSFVKSNNAVIIGN